MLFNEGKLDLGTKKRRQMRRQDSIDFAGLISICIAAATVSQRIERQGHCRHHALIVHPAFIPNRIEMGSDAGSKSREPRCVAP